MSKRPSQGKSRRSVGRAKPATPYFGPHQVSEIEEQFHLSGGVVASRKGGDLLLQNIQTPEEHAAHMRGLRAFRDVASKIIAERAARLRDLCTPYDSLEVIAQFAFAEQAFDPNDYRESEHQGSDAYAEYLTSQLLSQPHHSDSELWITPEAMTAIRGAVSEIFRLTMHYHRSVGVADDFRWTDDPMEAIRLEGVIWWLHVRNPAFAPHLEEWLRELFSHPTLVGWMRSTLGFTIEDALRLNRAAEEGPTAALVERIVSAQRWRRELDESIRQARRLPKDEQTRVGEELSFLLAKSPSERKIILQSEQVARSFLGMAPTLSYTPATLAGTAGCSEEVARGYLGARSLTFGDIPAGLDRPAPALHIHLRPFVRHQDQFMSPHPDWLNGGLREFLEDRLRAGGRVVWTRYCKIRGDMLERRAVNILRTALPGAQSWQKLYYTIEEGGGEKRAELDALFIFDRAVILLETKAAALNVSARSGGVKSLERNLKDILGEAHRQGLRARKYIEESVAPEFLTEDGQRVALDRNWFDHLLVVTVSLEPLNVFTATFREAAKAGILAEGSLPWAVSLFDLRVICDLIEFPSQLIHYILRRMTIPALERFSASDELDWFASYLETRLRFPPVDPSLGFKLLESQTNDIEQYYYFLSGMRTTPAEKPQMNLPATIRALLREVEERHPPNYLPGALMLLDMTLKDCRDLTAMIKKSLRDARRRPGVHVRDMTRNEGQKEGLTLAVANMVLARLENGLEAHCNQRLIEEDAKYWVGLGLLIESGASLQSYCVSIRSGSELVIAP